MAGKADGLPEAAEVVSDAADEHTRRLTELYEQQFDFVWRSVRMLGASPETADDAVQDVFLVAHRRLADFEARSAPRTWLFAIAYRVVSDHRRSRNRRKRLVEQATTMEREPSSTPYEQAVRGESHAQLRLALASLPEERRAVFMLAELEEMSAPEIAAALGINPNTVYSRLRLARRDMAERLKQLADGARP